MRDDIKAEDATATQVGDITEKQVRAFLLGVAERLLQFIPGNGLIMVRPEVSLFGSGNDTINWTIYAAGGDHESANRLEDAFNAQVFKMNPKFIAERLRKEAQDKIAQAEKLEANEPAQ